MSRSTADTQAHTTHSQTGESNPERKERILDAAAALFLHYGVDKTTVSDIAEQAGVSKGAIYLHFKSKEDLVETLMIREMQKYGAIWLTSLLEDPEGGTLGSLYRHSLAAMVAVPFMSALYRRDIRVLGTYLRKPDNKFVSIEAHAMRIELIRALQEAGTVRRDVEPAVIAKVMEMLGFGFIHLAELEEGTAAQDEPSVAAMYGVMGDMMDCAFTPEGVNAEAGKAVIRRITEKALATFFQTEGIASDDSGT